MKKITIMIIYICINHSFAQEVKLGFRTEIFTPFYEKTDMGQTFKPYLVPPNLYFTLAFKPTENFQIDIRPGYSIVEDYGGFEFGGYLKYFASESIYLLASYNLHFMRGEAHGFHSNNDATFSMPGLGVGFVTGKYSSLEFQIFIPSPKEWQNDVEVEIGGYKGIKTTFTTIIKVGFGFSWPI